MRLSCTRTTHLDVFRHLMQRETFEPTEADEVIYPVHDHALVPVGAPESIGDHIGEYGAAKCGDVRRGTRHICETRLFDSSGLGIGSGLGLVTVSYRGGERSIIFWLKSAFPPVRLGG